MQNKLKVKIFNLGETKRFKQLVLKKLRSSTFGTNNVCILFINLPHKKDYNLLGKGKHLKCYLSWKICDKLAKDPRLMLKIIPNSNISLQIQDLKDLNYMGFSKIRFSFQEVDCKDSDFCP